MDGQWPHTVDQEEKPYWEKRFGISIVDNCLLWGDRVTVPPSLHSSVLNLIHSSHFGMNYSKAMVRSLVWWPKIDVDVANTVRTCPACQLTAKRPATQWSIRPDFTYIIQRIVVCVRNLVPRVFVMR